jgi:hypothetical protein
MLLLEGVSQKIGNTIGILSSMELQPSTPVARGSLRAKFEERNEAEVMSSRDFGVV